MDTVQCVVMGVSGSGKSTVGRLLSDELAADFAEGDDFHPASNVAKMAAGVPLDDADRAPWLQALAAWIRDREAARRTAVVTCSALKRSYRDVLRAASPSLVFVHLTGSRELLAARLGARQGHYMPPSLLGSQLDTLEPLAPEEPGGTVDVAPAPEAIVEDVIRGLRLSSRS